MKTTNEVSEFCDKHNACSGGRDWAMTQATMAGVFDKCERGDWLMWALQKQGALDKPTSVKLACEFALRVLPIYEAKYKREEPRLAIEAALRWLENQTEENARAAYRAADGAYNAANSAADSAYNAAYSAANSAYSAAYATNSAVYATNSSADSAADSAAESKQQCEIIRNLVKNPWRK